MKEHITIICLCTVDVTPTYMCMNKCICDPDNQLNDKFLEHNAAQDYNMDVNFDPSKVYFELCLQLENVKAFLIGDILADDVYLLISS